MAKKKRIILILIIAIILLWLVLRFWRIFLCEYDFKQCMERSEHSFMMCKYKCATMYWHSIFRRYFETNYNNELE
jgi:hypothetical protein